MKAHKFVAEHGIEKAKEILDNAPDDALYFNLLIDGRYYKMNGNDLMYGSDNDVAGGCWVDSVWPISDLKKCSTTIDIEKLKQVVKSVEIVKSFGGLADAKVVVEMGKYYKYLQKAITDYELVERSKGGEI